MLEGPLNGRHVAVVGAGTSGLTTGILARRMGAAVTMLEQREAIVPRTAGLASFHLVLNQISHRVLLPVIGVHLPEVRNIVGRAVVNSCGRRVLDLQPYGPSPLHRYNAIPRRRLLEALYDEYERLGGATLLRARVHDLVPPHVIFSVADGPPTLLRADLVVGADGAWSRVRSLISESRRSDAGIASDGYSWVALTASSEPAVHLPGDRTLMAPLQGGVLHVAIPSEDDGVSILVMFPSEHVGRVHRVGQRQVRKLFEPLRPGLLGLLDDPGSAIIGSPIREFRYATAEKWHDDFAVLVGDSCHASAPHTGGGAGSGIGDAFALAAFIEGSPQDLPAAFRAYQENRKPVADAIQSIARSHGTNLTSGGFASVADRVVRTISGVRSLLHPAGSSEYQRILFETMPPIPESIRIEDGSPAHSEVA